MTLPLPSDPFDAKGGAALDWREGLGVVASARNPASPPEPPGKEIEAGFFCRPRGHLGEFSGDLQIYGSHAVRRLVHRMFCNIFALPNSGRRNHCRLCGGRGRHLTLNVQHGGAMKPVTAFVIGLSLEIGLCGATSHAQASEPTVSLRCVSVHGVTGEAALEHLRKGDPDPEDYEEDEYEAYKRDMQELRVLDVCGQTFATKAACETARNAVNNWRPLVEGEGQSKWQLVGATCSPTQPPKPLPKPKQLFNLHCRGFYGDISEVPAWMSVGGEFERVLRPCGSRMEKADCEAAAAVVNDFRPVIEGLVGWRLFFASCSERQPFTMI